MTFRHTDKSGLVIANLTYSTKKYGSSDIEIVESPATVTLDHRPRRVIIVPPKTSFTVAGKKVFLERLH